MQRCKYLSELLRKQKQKEESLSDGDAAADTEQNDDITVNAQKILKFVYNILYYIKYTYIFDNLHSKNFKAFNYFTLN